MKITSMDNNNYMNEKFLLEGLIKGSEVAYAYFFNNYYKDLCNYLLAISGDSVLTEEIAQQTFVKLWYKRESLSIQDNALKPYFFRNLVDIDNSQYEQKLKLIDDEIENLPDQCKKVFILGKKEGLKYQEISEKLDISIKTVEVHMSKALKRLRTQLTIFL